MSLITDSQHLRIPFIDIERGTRNFNLANIIGKGGYGDVYQGELILSGKLTSVAVKRLHNRGQGVKEFLTELQLLSRYKHPNLVPLLGYCNDDNEMILVYEYAHNGSLQSNLTMDKTPFSLPWKHRINICIEAAYGLDYLHNHVEENQRVIHRDIKSANILLDHKWKARISDLGLSRICRANEDVSYVITNPCGTHGYLDPAYNDTGMLTKESDVFSFGMVLFEVMCGESCLKNVNDAGPLTATLARSCYEKGNLNDIIHPDLMKQMDSDSLNTFSKIAYECLQKDRTQRPSMGLVVEKLEKSLELQELADASELLAEDSEWQSQETEEALESLELGEASEPLAEALESQAFPEVWKSSLARSLETQSYTLKVNIHCNECKRMVTKTLQKIDGVCTVGVDSEHGKVTVLGNVDPKTLLKKLAKSGKPAEILGTSSMNKQITNQFKNVEIDS
ncbi:unnamed protein product [Lactuca saligna]|uniref:Protein kinase domain-containing protein n=1 Tax=Lactuca saligna TaxID=75948 RepID=A0AA35VZP5_LACSI|nr:unnamed protein product [Lactuca saligna]